MNSLSKKHFCLYLEKYEILSNAIKSSLIRKIELYSNPQNKKQMININNKNVDTVSNFKVQTTLLTY